MTSLKTVARLGLSKRKASLPPSTVSYIQQHSEVGLTRLDSFEGVSSVDTQSVFTDMEEALSYKQEKSSKDLQVYREDTKDANMVQADDANMDEPTSTTKRQLISGRGESSFPPHSSNSQADGTIVTPEGHSPKKIKTSPSHTEIRHQALLLQNQLSAFTRTLEGTGPSPLPLGFDLVDKPATTMNATNDLMTVTESKYLASADKKIKKLNKKNAVLQQQLDVLWTKVRVMQEDADLRGQSGEYDRVTMGIDPQVVQLLAVDLVTGDRSRGVIAEEMFSLVERAIPLVSDPDELKRTKMAPRERLRSLEGVVDISLGRVELLEQKIKAIEDPSWFKPSGPIVGYTSDDDDEDTEDGRSKAEKVKDEAWADEVVASTSSSTNAAR